MKKSILIFIIVLLFVFTGGVAAQDSCTLEYYNSEIEVGTDKSSFVKEQLFLNFDSAQTSFEWQFPRFDHVEDYAVEDIAVEGCEVQVTETPRAYLLTIQSPEDDPFLGKRTITIQHKRIAYRDHDDGADWFYCDLVPTVRELPIDKAKVKITFPSQIMVHNLYFGPGGRSGDDGFLAKVEENVMTVRTTRIAKTGESLRLKARLNPGTFPDAPSEPFTYAVEQLTSTMKVDVERVLHVEESVSFRFDAETGIIHRGIGLWDETTARAATIANLEVIEGDVAIVDVADDVAMVSYGSESKPADDIKTFRYTYDLIFPDDISKEFDYFHAGVPGYYWFCPIDRFEASLELPGKPKNFDITIGRFREEPISGERTPLINERNPEELTEMSSRTISVADEGLAARESATIETTLVAYTFIKKWNDVEKVTPYFSLGAILCTLILLILFGRRRRVKTTPTWQIPDGLNPAEVRFLLDRRISNSDSTALLFDWASRGYLAIDSSKDGVHLRRRAPMGDDCRPYEHRLYLSLWTIEDVNVRNVIPYSDLRTFLVGFTSRLRRGVQTSFTKQFHLQDYVAATISWLSTLLAVVPLLILWLSIMVNIEVPESDFIRYALLGAGCMLAFCLLCHGWFLHLRHAKEKSEHPPFWRTSIAITIIVFVAITVAAIMIAAYFKVHFIPIIAALLASYLILLLITFIRRPSRYGEQVEAEVLDFCSLLAGEDDVLPEEKQAKEERYWRLLPYAIGLGLTEQWTARYEGRILTLPRWYNVGCKTLRAEDVEREIQRVIPLISLKFRNHMAPEWEKALINGDKIRPFRSKIQSLRESRKREETANPELQANVAADTAPPVTDPDNAEDATTAPAEDLVAKEHAEEPVEERVEEPVKERIEESTEEASPPVEAPESVDVEPLTDVATVEEMAAEIDEEIAAAESKIAMLEEHAFVVEEPEESFEEKHKWFRGILSKLGKSTSDSDGVESTSTSSKEQETYEQ